MLSDMCILIRSSFTCLSITSHAKHQRKEKCTQGTFVLHGLCSCSINAYVAFEGHTLSRISLSVMSSVIHGHPLFHWSLIITAHTGQLSCTFRSRYWGVSRPVETLLCVSFGRRIKKDLRFLFTKNKSILG